MLLTVLVSVAKFRILIICGMKTRSMFKLGLDGQYVSLFWFGQFLSAKDVLESLAHFN